MAHGTAKKSDVRASRSTSVSLTLNAAITPIAMIMFCPLCHARHIDQGVFATKPHHTHSCQTCGLTWRPAVCDTVGVQFLPGFKDEPPAPIEARVSLGKFKL